MDPRYEVTWLVRRLFRALAETADRYLADSGLSAAERAVMEFLYPDERLAVPDIARRYSVSRQHVQVTVNSLLGKGLLRTDTNPHHKRSKLIRLSEAGRETFAEIRRNEAAEIDRLFAKIPSSDVATTRDTLAAVLSHLGP